MNNNVRANNGLQQNGENEPYLDSANNWQYLWNIATTSSFSKWIWILCWNWIIAIMSSHWKPIWWFIQSFGWRFDNSFYHIFFLFVFRFSFFIFDILNTSDDPRKKFIFYDSVSCWIRFLSFGNDANRYGGHRQENESNFLRFTFSHTRSILVSPAFVLNPLWQHQTNRLQQAPWLCHTFQSIHFWYGERHRTPIQWLARRKGCIINHIGADLDEMPIDIFLYWRILNCSTTSSINRTIEWSLIQNKWNCVNVYSSVNNIG